MEEASQSRVPAEPSEEELRGMLEERERKQAGDWGRLKRLSTRVVLSLLVLGCVGIFATGLHRDLAREFDPAPPADPRKPEPVTASTPAESVEAVLGRTSGLQPGVAPAGDGKIINQDDIRFTMQLLNFMQGKPKDGTSPAPDAEPTEGR